MKSIKVDVLNEELDALEDYLTMLYDSDDLKEEHRKKCLDLWYKLVIACDTPDIKHHIEENVFIRHSDILDTNGVIIKEFDIVKVGNDPNNYTVMYRNGFYMLHEETNYEFNFFDLERFGHLNKITIQNDKETS